MGPRSHLSKGASRTVRDRNPETSSQLQELSSATLNLRMRCESGTISNHNSNSSRSERSHHGVNRHYDASISP